MKFTEGMNIRIIIAVALAAAFAVTASAEETQDKQEKKKPQLVTRTSLKRENEELRARLDSMKMELEKYRLELEYTDSITNEMLALYEENEDKSAAGINPEDYTAEVSDSLLNLWYVHSKVNSEDITEYDMDSVRFESNVPDEVYIERIRQMNSFITLPYNDIVKNYIILYSEKMNTRMSNILGLCKYYMPIFEEILNKYDMPEELKAMAVIESAMNPRAVSRAGAKGMWQFMYATAKMYGLHIDSFVDERLDPVKAAEAAAQYLQDSYEIFGDWNLAIASYNCGAGNVNKAIRRSGGKRAFWDIWPYLPRETRGYVPAFVGALYAMTYHKEHGICPMEPKIPVATDTVHISKNLHFNQIADVCGADIEAIRALNPQYLKDIVPGENESYVLRLPNDIVTSFLANEDSIYKHRESEFFPKESIEKMLKQAKLNDDGRGSMRRHKIKNGENLGSIARKYRVTVKQIMKWNNMRNTKIRAGRYLKIYK